MKVGLRILGLALEAPRRQIGENSGADGGVVVEKIMTAPAMTGFDAATGEYGEMFERGIIDPLKVVRVAHPECGLPRRPCLSAKRRRQRSRTNSQPEPAVVE